MPNPVGVRRLRLDIRLADTDSAMRLVFGAIIEIFDGSTVPEQFGFITLEASSPDESQAAVVVYQFMDDVKKGEDVPAELLDKRDNSDTLTHMTCGSHAFYVPLEENEPYPRCPIAKAGDDVITAPCGKPTTLVVEANA